MKNLRYIRFVIILAGMLPFALLQVTGATRTASSTGNWSSTTTWGGSAVPTSDDDVRINSGITVTVDVADAQCQSLDFLANSVQNVVTISGTNSLTVSGLVNMQRPSTTNRSNRLQVNAGALVCGSLTMNATTGNRRNHLDITTGTVAITGSFTAGSDACRVNFTDAGSLSIGGATSGTPRFTTYGGCTVNYTGDVNQDVFEATYYNLGFSGAGTKKLYDGTLYLHSRSLLSAPARKCMAGGHRAAGFRLSVS